MGLQTVGQDWNSKVGSQEIPGVTGKFVLGVIYIYIYIYSTYIYIYIHTHTHIYVYMYTHTDTHTFISPSS